MRPATKVALIAIAALMNVQPALAIKRGPYPEVKVEVAGAFAPDDAFKAMRKSFADAVSKKDTAALFRIVGPTFLWTTEEGRNDQFDMGRSALDNFKVVFGFRAPDADADGNVENGPYWDTLAAFAAEDTFYEVEDAGNLVCSPAAGEVADSELYDKAQASFGDDDAPEWYFTLRPVSVAKSAGDKSEIAKIGTVALPLLSVSPEQGTPSQLEVLLPSGKSGWIPATAARPLQSERLCFAKTPKGEWKIVQYDQLPQ